MRGRRVFDGYLVCLDLSVDLPGNGARNPSCYLLSMRWFSLEEERMMQQSSVSISLSFENQGINPVGGSSKFARTYTNKQELATNGAPAKTPRWDLTDTEGCGGGNSFSCCSWMFSGYVEYIGGRSRPVDARGAHKGGGRAHPQGACRAPSWPPRLFLDFHSKSSGSRLFQKSRSRRFHSVWTPFDIPSLRNTEIGKKQQYGPGLRLVG